MPAGPVGSVWKSGSWSATAWAANTWANASAAAGNAILDLNTRLYVYLNSYYGYNPPKDLATLVPRYLAGLTGDYMNRWNKMVDDATA